MVVILYYRFDPNLIDYSHTMMQTYVRVHGTRCM